ncbi:hypothetical protein T02_12419 [Trichinella nativa]|uniref:Uncharacterized protein n=1 Tax=Trichinella nativa TaxID=6335 RepID=A0A0V1LK93_9BILA|nr:hypothetical protein T02_12419 [Trichinella nativa]
MDIGRARQPYTTLNALWNEWTSGIQQLMCDGLGADGYRWPNNCSNDWLDSASQFLKEVCGSDVPHLMSGRWSSRKVQCEWMLDGRSGRIPL